MRLKKSTRVSRFLAAGAAAALIAPLAGVSTASAAFASVPQPDCNSIWQRSGSGFYESNPTYTDPRNDNVDWQTATPESVGLHGALIDEGAVDLFTNRSLLSLLVLREGKLVYEKYGNGGGQRKSNNVHSASKSILQALVGIAVEEGDIGSLDDKASSYIPSAFQGQSQAKKNITIRQLIDMTSGLRWEDDETEYTIETSSNWVKAIIARPLDYTPGQHYNYSTGNTHVLSAVLQAATGMSTCKYAQTMLLDPMNISPEHWGRDPQGVYSGGYNLYLTARELAKFGQLYLDEGEWNGQQLVPEETVEQAATKKHYDGDGFWYSSGWWWRTIDGHDMYLAWGWGGQFVYVIPDLDIVLVTTENTADGHNNTEINSGDFIGDYLIPAVFEEC